ncbi:HAD hydrolase family protein [Auraticoccus sp. F435]|uniref:N-acylneuraminate cytidylyltransferase n=1 Tax=Auraticoccus cholistanensis TaxID=2656650 RepID=A0A6A9USX5_9ACTN|nr:acylneuraminate cytidylyltransferase [Auraticoccus cholistanensis]MVA76026.1 HAD hydrolase family protein [Auraticoccus cholistanensis]
MTNVAIIPARGGSQGVPGKNLRPVGGVPLVARAVRACLAARRVDRVYVTTDDAAIGAAARAAGAEVVERPADLAGHTASSESALLHALDAIAASGVDPEVTVFVQCTSPFIRGEDVDAGVALVAGGTADSAFSAVETYEFLWRDADPSQQPGTGPVVGQNHDARHRPRRQDRRPDFRETGAFYVMRTAGFREHRHRFFGRTQVVPVSELSSLEIDTVEELALADAVAAVLDRSGEPAAAAPIDVDAVVTDFDGVHTADTAYLDQDGRETVRVSRSDGLGVSFLRRAGVPVLILSREQNPVVAARAAKLQVEVRHGVLDKTTALRQWMDARGLDPARVAYVGNDLNDLGPLSLVGWPVTVPEAHPSVRRAARVVLSRPGGQGAVRELAERVLASRPEWVGVVSEVSSGAPAAHPATAIPAAAPEPAAAAALGTVLRG